MHTPREKPYEDTVKGGIHELRREVSMGPNTVGTFILDFQPPELGKNELMLFQPFSVWYFVMAA